MKTMAKLASILVINMDVLFSFVAHHGVDNLTKFILPTDFVVIDEAHMLAKRGGELFKHSQLRPFNVESFTKSLKDFAVVRGTIDTTMFRKIQFPEVLLAKF